MLREQEESDADLARRLHEEEQNKQPVSRSVTTLFTPTACKSLCNYAFYPDSL